MHLPFQDRAPHRDFADDLVQSLWIVREIADANPRYEIVERQNLDPIVFRGQVRSHRKQIQIAPKRPFFPGEDEDLFPFTEAQGQLGAETLACRP